MMINVICVNLCFSVWLADNKWLIKLPYAYPANTQAIWVFLNSLNKHLLSPYKLLLLSPQVINLFLRQMYV